MKILTPDENLAREILKSVGVTDDIDFSKPIKINEDLYISTLKPEEGLLIYSIDHISEISIETRNILINNCHKLVIGVYLMKEFLVDYLLKRFPSEEEILRSYSENFS